MALEDARSCGRILRLVGSFRNVDVSKDHTVVAVWIETLCEVISGGSVVAKRLNISIPFFKCSSAARESTGSQ